MDRSYRDEKNCMEILRTEYECLVWSMCEKTISLSEPFHIALWNQWNAQGSILKGSS